MAGIGYTMAQTVYSVNVVGYVNKTCPQGYTLLANPLSGTNNALATIIPVAPDGASVIRWDSTTQAFAGEVPVYSTFVNAWDANPTLAPGEGFFFNNPDAAAFTITFVGEVLTGSLTNTIVPNYNLLGSKVPQKLGLQAAGVQAFDGDTVYFWDAQNQRYASTTPVYSTFINAWDPEEPAPEVGEGFFYLSFNPQSVNWVRNFTIN